MSPMLPRDGAIPARRRLDYRPPPFLVAAVELEFDLDPEATFVRTTFGFRRNPEAATADREAALVLDGEQQDDVEVTLDGRPARLHASQGQLRALVLALKTSEILYVREKTNDPPVLLLDDVSSELDPERNAFLLEFVAEIGCQTVITTTDRKHLGLEGKHLTFKVDAGVLSPLDPG